MAEPDIRALITEKALCAKNDDYFGLLGLTPEATKPEVQKAYFDLAKVLHPDRMKKHDLGDLDADAARVFKVLSDAYGTLMDPAKRQAYVDKRGLGGLDDGPRTTQELIRAKTDPADPDVTAKEAAKIFYHKGAMLLKKGGFEEAQKYFQRALDSDTENPRYQLQLGWSIFQNTALPERKRLAESQQYLQSAIKGDGENPQAHYFMARWYKAKGNTKECRAHLKMALQFRENYIEAKRELRLLDMRERKGGGKGSSSASGGGRDSGRNTGKSAKVGGNQEGRWPFGLDRLFKKKK